MRAGRGLRDRDEAVGDVADGVVALARLCREGGFDEPRRVAEAILPISLGLLAESLHDRVEPEAAFEVARGGHGIRDAREQDAQDVGLGAERFTFDAKRGEEAIARLHAAAIQAFGEDLAFGLGSDVLHDAEQVARIGPLGKGLRTSLRFEDPETVDDGVLGVPRDGDTDVPLGIEQRETGEVVVEEREHLGSSARFERASYLLLALT